MIEIIKYLDESGVMYILCLLGSIYLYVIIERQYHQIISLKKQRDAFKSWLIMERQKWVKKQM